MKAQALQHGRKTLEINPNHPVVIGLLAKVKSGKVDVAAMDTMHVHCTG